jgi:hypothetical protein
VAARDIGRWFKVEWLPVIEPHEVPADVAARQARLRLRRRRQRRRRPIRPRMRACRARHRVKKFYLWDTATKRGAPGDVEAFIRRQHADDPPGVDWSLPEDPGTGKLYADYIVREIGAGRYVHTRASPRGQGQDHPARSRSSGAGVSTRSNFVIVAGIRGGWEKRARDELVDFPYGRSRRHRRCDLRSTRVQDIVATAVRRTLMLVKGATWRAQPPIGSGAEGERIAEAMTSILLAPRAMARPFPRVTSRQFMHIFDGSSIQVWTGKNRDDGLFGIQDIQPRPPGTIQRWDVDVDGTLNGVWQTSPWTGQQIPIPRKRIDLHSRPRPQRLARGHRHPAPRRRVRAQPEAPDPDRGLGLRDEPRRRAGRAHPIRRARQGQVEDKKITPQQRDQYIKGAKSFIEQRVITPGRGLALESQHYVDKDGNLTPFEMFDIELLSVTGGDQAALDKAIERWLLAIARLFGIEGLFLGADSKGSFALSKDKTYMLVQIITSGSERRRRRARRGPRRAADALQRLGSEARAEPVAVADHAARRRDDRRRAPEGRTGRAPARRQGDQRDPRPDRRVAGARGHHARGRHAAAEAAQEARAR